MARKSSFTDNQKAQIYVRDHATCAFSGKLLWILDYGATPYWNVDWVDHILPVSRGGKSTIENGICASYTFNSKKSQNSRDNGYFFREGKATNAFFYFFETIPAEVAGNLKRFSRLHISDWYFNRALYRLMLGVDYLWNRSTYTRDPDYYASSATKAIVKWRAIQEREAVQSIEERGLLNSISLTEDQKLMLNLRAATGQKQVRRTMNALVPYFRVNHLAMESWLECETKIQATTLLKELKADPRVSPRVIANIRANMQIL